MRNLNINTTDHPFLDPPVCRVEQMIEGDFDHLRDFDRRRKKQDT